MTLSAEVFPAFFREVWGYQPFPWQVRLLNEVAATGAWPPVLDLPTGSGKTAAIDIAVFHLALQAGCGCARQAPVRIALVVDRRLVVDDAFDRAGKLAKALGNRPGPVAAEVAASLKRLAGDGPPLIAARLRGGIPLQEDWARSPSQPTVLCSTVDQLGSRLLFRGYGVSDRMKPLHAGLIGADCLILLDEAHLADPFRQTLGWVRMYKGPNWRERADAAPWGVVLLTATPGDREHGEVEPFRLEDDDRSDATLRPRLEARKPASLVDLTKARAGADEPAGAAEDSPHSDEAETGRRSAVIVQRVQAALRHPYGFSDDQRFPAIAVVVNRVARARAVYNRLKKIVSDEDADLLLLIGPARPVDRDELVREKLTPIRTRKIGAPRTLLKPLIIVATQCIEAGVDIDLDALITEAAPLDALRQRFGRLNRAGRDITPYAAVIVFKSDLGKNDPVYGNAIRASWERLVEAGSGKVDGERTVDFGVNAFAFELDDKVVAPKGEAPVLLPAHLDLLSQTSPVPAADPDVALYLHGADRQPDSISVIWRADLQAGLPRDDVVQLLTLVPPRSGEAIGLPIGAVRRWLRQPGARQVELADVASLIDDEAAAQAGGGLGRVFRWKGTDDERSQWIRAGELRPGDAIVAPASYGGVDQFGWNPSHREPAEDVAQRAAAPFAGRSFAVRIAPGLLGDAVSPEALADALAAAASQSWQDLHAAVSGLALPDELREALGRLSEAKGTSARGRASKVAVYLDLYGEDGEERPRGIVFVAPFGIRGEAIVEAANSTEDDWVGSMPGFTLRLALHSQDVREKAAELARAAGLPDERVADLALAGYLHDAGKADPRFQALLNYGDPLGPDPDAPVLAKSSRPLPRRARDAADLPKHWRHEALSVRLAPLIGRFADAHDPDLVLWLLGTHHGYGRPLFPHSDPADANPPPMPAVLDLPRQMPPGPGPQSLAFDWHGLDWPSLFVRLKERYGVWELARMEAILRLADHRASEKRATEGVS